VCWIRTAHAGCPKGQPDFSQEKKRKRSDYDAAYVYYQKAVKYPNNASLQDQTESTRSSQPAAYQNGSWSSGRRATCKALRAEFQRAQTIDPASAIADRSFARQFELIEDKKTAVRCGSGAPADRRSPMAGDAAGNQAILTRGH